MEEKILVYFIKFLYSTFLFPPGIIIIALLLLFLHLYKRRCSGVRVGFLLLFIFYLSSIPLISGQLIRSLEARHEPPSYVQGDVIVMLGGGATLDTPNVHGLGHLSGFAANRLLTCAQLYHSLHVPILVSGGKVLESTGTEADIAKVILMGLGVPADQIIAENQSLNTTENATYTKKIIDQHGFVQPILVTSAFHMERSILQFSKAGLSVIPYPTDYQTNVHWSFELYQLWPSASALLDMSLALKEYTGILAIKWY